jgi:HEAT repeat protein
MRTSIVIKSLFLGLLACGAVLTANDAKSDPQTSHGFSSVYGNVPADQVEFLSTPDRIKSVAANGAPMAVWEALEHGEKVECLDCIAAVAPLLYDSNARTREIAAWWLRRRILGVFGPGEVYQQTLNTLASDSNAQRRAYAAYAIGEFLEGVGIAPVAQALRSDSDPTVRAAAASALGRLNDEGAGALGASLADGDPRVKSAALGAAGRINSFTGIASVAGVLGDGDPNVRRQAAQLLDQMHAKDSSSALIALAKSDPDENVRIAACHALGTFGDPSASASLNFIASNDTSSLVRDMATIALKQL